jgi:hypothetical protein
MTMTFPSPQMQLTLAGVLTAAPTGATPSGLYTQIGGTPPSGIALGDIFSWSGSAAILYRTFSYAPSAITIGAATWSKTAGTWLPDGGLTVQGILTAAPVAGTAAGLWATNVAFGPAAAGDIVYLPGGVATGTRYLTFANAPAAIASGNASFVKVAGLWVAANAVPGTMTVASSAVIIGATVTAPTKPTSMTVDYITVVDDGSGWCRMQMCLSAESGSSGASAGNGIYLFTLPGGYKFDLTTHPANSNTSTGVNNAIEISRMIPGSKGFITRNDSSYLDVVASVYDSTRFFIFKPFEWNKVRSDWFQTNYGGGFSYSMAFMFKKG